MDDVTVGRLLRAVRIRREWRQADVAARAGLSRSQVSLAERGRIDGMRLADVRRIAATLEIRIGVGATWRGGDVDRITNDAHVALQGRILTLLPHGWITRAEVPLPPPHRGVVDLLAWHPAQRALLLIEAKTELADPGALLAQVGRYRRALPTLANELGWGRPAAVGCWIAVSDRSMNRRRVDRAGLLLRGAYPGGGGEVRRWLRDPAAGLEALSFVAIAPGSSARRAGGPIRRVRVARSSVRTVGSEQAASPMTPR